MDIVIDIQGFRDAEGKFMPKEVAVVAVNEAFISHCIMMAPYPFVELAEKYRRENNWLSRNFHGIEWFDGTANSKQFMAELREIARQARYIYTRGREKVHYLENTLARNVYNLEGISPAFKNLSEGEEHELRCSHHGFHRNSDKFHCALRNACKLRYWMQSQEGSCDICSANSFIDESSDDSDTESEVFTIKRNFPNLVA